MYSNNIYEYQQKKAYISIFATLKNLFSIQ